jgi:hypothetical protein
MMGSQIRANANYCVKNSQPDALDGIKRIGLSRPADARFRLARQKQPNQHNRQGCFQNHATDRSFLQTSRLACHLGAMASPVAT